MPVVAVIVAVASVAVAAVVVAAVAVASVAAPSVVVASPPTVVSTVPPLPVNPLPLQAAVALIVLDPSAVASPPTLESPMPPLPVSSPLLPLPPSLVPSGSISPVPSVPVVEVALLVADSVPCDVYFELQPNELSAITRQILCVSLRLRNASPRGGNISPNARDAIPWRSTREAALVQL